MNKYLFAAILLLPGTAHAWEQTMTCGDGVPCAEGLSPLPTHWQSACVAFHLNENGTEQMAFDDVRTVVQKSIAAWHQPDDSSLHPYYSGLTNETRIGYNPYIDENANIIVFRDNDTWTESRAMMALTTVTHRNSTGVIYDADIEINTSDYIYGIYEQDGAEVVDLENTLTHEIGHVFGLSHSGEPEATMFPYASAGEIGLRKLSGDDISAISTIYPLSAPGECRLKHTYFERPPYEMNEGPAHGGCSIQPAQTVNEFGILASLLVFFGVLFCRRRYPFGIRGFLRRCGQRL